MNAADRRTAEAINFAAAYAAKSYRLVEDAMTHVIAAADVGAADALELHSCIARRYQRQALLWAHRAVKLRLDLVNGK